MADGPGGLPVYFVDPTQSGPGGIPVLVAGFAAGVFFGGESLARATSTAQDVVTTSEADLVNMSITFTVPTNRDVWVLAKVKGVEAGTASAIVTVKLTDAAATAKDSDNARSGTASRNPVTIILDEVIPAGSGTVTRKLRAVSTSADGVTNVGGASRNTLEAFVR